MNTINQRSPYWLSPGIDVPTRDEFLSLLSRRTLRGFYVDRDTGESAFVPTADFMRESPLWRIDVLDDIADGLQRTRTHALVAFFRQCQARNHDVPMARQLAASRDVSANRHRAAGRLGGVARPRSTIPPISNVGIDRPGHEVTIDISRLVVGFRNRLR